MLEMVFCMLSIYVARIVLKFLGLLFIPIFSYAITNWYRIDADGGKPMCGFRIALQEIMSSKFDVFDLGELTIHHMPWCRHSIANISPGEQMQEKCSQIIFVCCFAHNRLHRDRQSGRNATCKEMNGCSI